MASPVGQHDAGRLAFRVPADRDHVGPDFDAAALVPDQAREGIERGLHAPSHDGGARGFERETDHLDHLARIGAFRSKARMQHPGCEERTHEVGRVAPFEMRPGRHEGFAEERREAAWSAPPELPGQGLEHRPRPELATEHGKDEARIGAEEAHLAVEGRAVARSGGLEGGAVGLPGAGQDEVAAVGAQYAGRDLGLREGKAALLELRAECRIGRRGDEQHEGRGHDVMHEAGRRHGIGPDTPADAVVALEDEDLAAFQAQHRGADEAVDAAPHDDIFGLRHATFSARRPW